MLPGNGFGLRRKDVLMTGDMILARLKLRPDTP